MTCHGFSEREERHGRERTSATGVGPSAASFGLARMWSGQVQESDAAPSRRMPREDVRTDDGWGHVVTCKSRQIAYHEPFHEPDTCPHHPNCR